MAATTEVISLTLYFTDNSGNDIPVTIPQSDPTQIEGRAVVAGKSADAYVREQMQAIIDTGVLIGARQLPAVAIRSYKFKKTSVTPVQ